jgi:hypothetical protein
MSEITLKWPLQNVYVYKANTGLLSQYIYFFHIGRVPIQPIQDSGMSLDI